MLVKKNTVLVPNFYINLGLSIDFSFVVTRNFNVTVALLQGSAI